MILAYLEVILIRIFCLTIYNLKVHFSRNFGDSICLSDTKFLFKIPDTIWVTQKTSKIVKGEGIHPYFHHTLSPEKLLEKTLDGLIQEFPKKSIAAQILFMT